MCLVCKYCEVFLLYLCKNFTNRNNILSENPRNSRRKPKSLSVNEGRNHTK